MIMPQTPRFQLALLAALLTLSAAPVMAQAAPQAVELPAANARTLAETLIAGGLSLATGGPTTT